jgi:hypothetical protein
MKHKLIRHGLAVLTASAALLYAAVPARAADKKPNVLMLMQDDTGGSTSVAMAEVRASVIRRRTWINSPRKARGSPAGMVRPVARQAAPRS